MKYLGSATLALLGTLALMTSASAAVVCNDEGDCWRTNERYSYPPEVNLNAPALFAPQPGDAS
jgi:hypothetical protein